MHVAGDRSAGSANFPGGFPTRGISDVRLLLPLRSRIYASCQTHAATLSLPAANAAVFLTCYGNFSSSPGAVHVSAVHSHAALGSPYKSSSNPFFSAGELIARRKLTIFGVGPTAVSRCDPAEVYLRWGKYFCIRASFTDKTRGVGLIRVRLGEPAAFPVTPGSGGRVSRGGGTRCSRASFGTVGGLIECSGMTW